MDILMLSQISVGGAPTSWDISLKAGFSTSLSGKTEEQQVAAIASFIQLGTIPGLEETGVNWVGLLTQQVDARQIDAEVRNNISIFTGAGHFIPFYNIKNGTLTLSIQEGDLNGNRL